MLCGGMFCLVLQHVVLSGRLYIVNGCIGSMSVFSCGRHDPVAVFVTFQHHQLNTPVGRQVASCLVPHSVFSVDTTGCVAGCLCAHLWVPGRQHD